MKTFITAQILSHLRIHPTATYADLTKKYRINELSVLKAMLKLKNAGMVVGEIRKEHGRGAPKDWRITTKGEQADKINPLGSGAWRHAGTIKTQAMSERLYRLREADAKAAANKRKFSGPAINEGEVEPIELPATKAGDPIKEVPAFFSAQRPGVYVLEPSSCAARAA
jgi:hypothetical protein